MRFTISQELRQEQRQVLTQRMIQSMEILQLTLLQLERRIDQELEKNPVLELEAESSSPSDAEEESVESERTNHSETAESSEHEPEIQFENPVGDSISTEEFSIADDFAQNYSDTIDEDPIRSQNWLEEQDSRISDAFANIPMPGETLQAHLEQQLGWFDISEKLREMTLRVINNLDPNGYFSYELGDFLGKDLTAEDLELAREALALVQRLEPAGVGSRNLRECLLLQVDPKSKYADVLKVLIHSYLEDISANRLPTIVRGTGFSLEFIQGAVAELRHFNPRPGAAFGSDHNSAIVPDVIVEKAEKGKYIVRMMEDSKTPQLRISKFYRDMLQKHGVDKDTKDYIRKKVGSAQWLLDAIEQRRITLLKVTQAIVDYQVDFFEKGEHALKPLKMQQIAKTIGVHITTISRACDEKWLISPQGVFPLRRFFVGGLAASDGTADVAHDVVRLKVQEIIDNENKREPLSDDTIVKMLEADGIQVARRTIVKYRQIMKIPSSRGRRKY